MGIPLHVRQDILLNSLVTVFHIVWKLLHAKSFVSITTSFPLVYLKISLKRLYGVAKTLGMRLSPMFIALLLKTSLKAFNNFPTDKMLQKLMSLVQFILCNKWVKLFLLRTCDQAVTESLFFSSTFATFWRRWRNTMSTTALTIATAKRPQTATTAIT